MYDIHRRRLRLQRAIHYLTTGLAAILLWWHLFNPNGLYPSSWREWWTFSWVAVGMGIYRQTFKLAAESLARPGSIIADTVFAIGLLALIGLGAHLDTIMLFGVAYVTLLVAIPRVLGEHPDQGSRYAGRSDVAEIEIARKAFDRYQMPLGSEQKFETSAVILSWMYSTSITSQMVRVGRTFRIRRNITRPVIVITRESSEPNGPVQLKIELKRWLRARVTVVEKLGSDTLVWRDRNGVSIEIKDTVQAAQLLAALLRAD